ncbi:hypothetical protein C2S53_018338 [Perilla frutescens var. hirtella]|uniref:Transposase MuDR plant domain-containing protein n=1 Tax=Perilla frutescens var. hirtella TaxID=608512 RepID=A0AAD4JGZ0_PERFH|nr:hypothetical protein C2S53_018338 [Perilla frutescens var. hirtella]
MRILSILGDQTGYQTTGGGAGSGIEPQYDAEPAPNANVAEGTAFYDATSTDYASGGPIFHDAQNDNAAVDDNSVVERDDNNDDEADLNVQSEDEEEPFEIGFSNCTCHDFTTWIHREGGINELLSMLIPTNQHASFHNQVEPEVEDVRNWIIPVRPLDYTDSSVVCDLDHVIDEPLRKGSVFYTKEYLYVAVGLWHMKRKAEFKVPHSYGSHVEYTCKRNPSCTFKLRASWRGSYWIVHKFNMQHTCNFYLGSVGARNIRARAVAAYFAHKMCREEKIIKP